MHGDVVKMLAALAGQSLNTVHRFLTDFSKTRQDNMCRKILYFYLVHITSSRMRNSAPGTCVVPLTRKACEVLQCLVGKPGQLVTKAALFEAVWPETVVSDNVLTNCIAELRQVLGDDAKRPRFIATIHRQGYRFLAPLSPPAPPQSGVAGPRPLVRPRP